MKKQKKTARTDSDSELCVYLFFTMFIEINVDIECAYIGDCTTNSVWHIVCMHVCGWQKHETVSNKSQQHI